MSDFFTSLAARAHNAQPPVRPRLPARFEPASLATAPAFDTPSELETIIEESAGAPAEAVRQRIAPSHAPSEERATAADMSPVPAVAFPRTAANTGTPVPPAPAERVPPVSVAPRVAPSVEETRPIARVQPAAEVHRNAPATEQPRETFSPVAQRREPLAPETRPATPAAIAPVPPRAPDAARRAPDEQPRPAMPPSPPAIAPRLAPARPPVSIPSPARARAQPETVVHVSIGRVEVRATAAAPERKREEARSPVMSLADYLRSRSGRNPS